MDNLVRRIQRVLREEFSRKNETVSLKDEDGVYGMVTSPRFRGLESRDRVAMIWDLLRAKLTPDERRRISMILAVTPAEQRGSEELAEIAAQLRNSN